MYPFGYAYQGTFLSVSHPDLLIYRLHYFEYMEICSESKMASSVMLLRWAINLYDLGFNPQSIHKHTASNL